MKKVLILLLFLFFATAAYADTWFKADCDGEVIVTDDITQIPKECRSNISFISKEQALAIQRDQEVKKERKKQVDSVRKAEDKSSQIAMVIQTQVNTGGYTGCSCRSIGNQLVQCDMIFPAGTSRYAVIANTQGVADLIAQAAALTSTIYYAGYSGNQKVCEFKYDMYSRTVERKF